MNIIPLPGFIFVEPVLRAEAERSTTIKGFAFKDPEFQGAPCMGKIYALPEVGADEFKLGEIIIFRNDPLPQTFKFDKVKLFAVPTESIAARYTGG